VIRHVGVDPDACKIIAVKSFGAFPR
jgi:hypothetical protein